MSTAKTPEKPEIDPASVYPYGERRLTVRLMRYWNECRGIRPMPEENDIDPDVLGDDWDYCLLLQVRDVANVQDYNFTYLGSAIARAYSDAALDDHNPVLVGPNASCLSHHFGRVIELQAPLVDSGETRTLHGSRLLYRQILMPLGDENNGVVAVFGAMNYKIVTD